MAMPSRRDVLRTSGVTLAAIAGCVGRDGPATDATTRSETTRKTTETTRRATETPRETTTENELGGCVPPSVPNRDWPLPDHDVANSNYAPSATGPKTEPSVRWRRTAEEPETDAYFDVRYTDPVVTDDRIFVGKPLLPGANTEMIAENYVHAYDRRSGDHIWTYPTGEEPPKSVAVTADTVYVPTPRSIRAVRRRDGTERWAFEAENGVEAVTPAEDRLYVTTGSASVVALRPDGSAVWTATVGDWSATRPAVADGTVFVGSDGGTVTAIRTDDGSENWSVGLAESDRENVGALAVTACGVFATAGGTVFGLDFDGSVRWRSDGGDHALSTDGRRVYAGTGTGRLHALAAADGRVEWTTFRGSENRRKVDGIYDDPVVTDGSVYLSTRPDDLYSFDAETGRENWRLTFDSLSSPGKPVVADGELFVSVGSSLLAYV